MSVLEYYMVVIVHVGLVPAVLFPLFYRRSPWRSTEVGKALMLKGVALAMLFSLAVAGFWWPFPGYDYLYAGVLSLVVVGITYQFLVLRKLQRRGRATVTHDGEF